MFHNVSNAIIAVLSVIDTAETRDEANILISNKLDLTQEQVADFHRMIGLATRLRNKIYELEVKQN